MDMPVEKTWNTDEFSNVAGALTWQARRQPNAIAIHYPKSSTFKKDHYESCTYRELNELSDCYARGLHQYGITPGTLTALMLTPGLDFFAVFFALFKAGAVPVLIDPGMGMKPLKQCLAEAGPKAFIGVTKAHFARKILGWAKESCELLVSAGPTLGLGGISLKKLREMGGPASGDVIYEAKPDDMAAILFTSGSTGAPKGVVYRHRHFNAQVKMLKEAFRIEPGEVSLPTFPPFALFDPALGVTTVVPDMDPTRPAEADPEKLVRTINRFKVTNIFGSPALLDTLSRYCVDHQIRMESVTRVISAGAAVPVRIIRRMENALYRDAAIHTPYGATECLPVSSISAAQLDDRMVDKIESGDGVCVGLPVEPNKVRIIRISEMSFNDISETTEMPRGMPGEIVVSGPSCTDSYWNRETDTMMSKFTGENGETWHRMGDVGHHGRPGTPLVLRPGFATHRNRQGNPFCRSMRSHFQPAPRPGPFRCSRDWNQRTADSRPVHRGERQVVTGGIRAGTFRSPATRPGPFNHPQYPFGSLPPRISSGHPPQLQDRT